MLKKFLLISSFILIFTTSNIVFADNHSLGGGITSNLPLMLIFAN